MEISFQDIPFLLFLIGAAFWLGRDIGMQLTLGQRPSRETAFIALAILVAVVLHG